MNYLGHIYFSNRDFDLMFANLFGDFVKGKKYEQYPLKIQQGIQLHRKIDDFIDNHPKVRILSKQLSTDLPKVAPIAIDLYFDHFLARHWKQFHAQNLNDFLTQFYAHPLNESHFQNPEFLSMIQQMRKVKWLSYYAQLDGIEKACKGVSSRISFPNALMNGREVLESNYEKIESIFFEFMEDAIAHFILDSTDA